jgi:asparagine synthase (glutamine-hydrolysing)
MCGIAGIFDPARPPRYSEIASMVAMQKHRGPDGAGHWVDGPVALGMRRLAIIDVAGGDQPIFNEDSTVAIVFNGEIYNYLELREDLIAKGHRFETRSDTEVLVHLYEELGAGMLPLLNGMFGFAIWDARRRQVFLARDRMGVKPMYVALCGSRWLFASESKSLLSQPHVDRELDLDSIADFLRLGYIPREGTPYKKIRKLLPGHALTLREDGSSLSRWWNLAEHQDAGEKDLDRLFSDSVKLRMRSDVPVAAFLSGGLDSSLVTIVAQEQAPNPINTFTLGFEHTEFDEMPYARLAAQKAGTAHRERIASPRDAIEHLPRLLWHMDEPMGDSSIIPNYLISRFAAEHVKVCLSGLGGDELFGGYSRYLDPGMGRIRQIFAPMPWVAGKLAPAVGRWSFSWSEELKLASSKSMEWRSYLHRLQIFHTRTLNEIGFPAFGRTESIVEDLWNQYPGTDPVSRRQFIDQHTYLPDEILALTDRMSMANGLEVRVPFLDWRLVRFSQALNSSQKQTHSHFKIFLKQNLGKKCPPEILSRPKWGFDTPLGQWVSQPELFAHIESLDRGEAVRRGLLRPAGIRPLIASPEAAKRASRRVWNLLVMEVWLRIHERLDPPAESLNDLLESAAYSRAVNA